MTLTTLVQIGLVGVFVFNTIGMLYDYLLAPRVRLSRLFGRGNVKVHRGVSDG